MDVTGRWHHRDLCCLYTCASRSGCIIESGMVEDDFPDLVFTIYEVPGDSVRVFEESELPPDWKGWPYPESSREFGSNALKSMTALVLSYPSAVFPDERIYVINTRHALMKSVKLIGIEEYQESSTNSF